MAVDIDSFKSDLEELKNKRSVIQAKLEEANRHVAELNQTLQSMGFSSVEEAKQAYLKQVAEAEQQHALVKQLIEEINQVDVNVPTREEVAERLKSLSVAPQDVHLETVESPVAIASVETKVEPDGAGGTVENISVQAVPIEPANDFVQQQIVPPNVNSSAKPANSNGGDMDLSGILFANL